MSYFDEEKYENTQENKNPVEEVAQDTAEDSAAEPYGVAYSPTEDGSYKLTSYVPSAEVPAPKKKGGNGKIVIAIVAIVLCIALAGVAGFAGSYVADRLFSFSDGGTDAPVTPPIPSGNSGGIVVSVPNESDEKPPVSIPRGELMSYADAAAMVKDSVVEITTEATVQGGGYFQQRILRLFRLGFRHHYAFNRKQPYRCIRNNHSHRYG